MAHAELTTTRHDPDTPDTLPAKSEHLPVVLSIDDKPVNLRVVEVVLEPLPCQVVSLGSGEEALTYLLTQPASVILLDVSMPGMDGYEVALLIRGRRQTRNTPILFITAAMCEEQDIQRGYCCGAIDYLVKPFDPLTLRSKVRLLLEYDQQKRQLLSAYQRLDEQHNYYQSLLSSAGEGVIGISPEGIVRFANPASQNLLGMSAQHLVGYPVQRLFHDGDQEADWNSSPFTAAYRNNTEVLREETMLYPPGRPPLPVSLRCSPMGGQQQGVVVIFRDIRQQLETESQLRQQALTDCLTGLLNRNGFTNALEKALSHAERAHQGLALLFIDLDRFKEINDTLGHKVGDIVLQQVAERLRHSLRREDHIARLGGDEFTIILEQLESPDRAAYSAQRILSVLERPLRIEDIDIQVRASIGIATYPDCGRTFTSLIEAADVAMYRAKEEGRHLYHFFTMEMNQRVQERLRREQQLRQALSEQQLFLLYQPQQDLHNGRLVGMEALLRWQPPGQPVQAAGAFLPLLEESGLIVPFGERSIELACRQRAAWLVEGWLDSACPLSINLSARQLADDTLPGKLEGLLKHYGVPPTLIELEFHEAALDQNNAKVIDNLHCLGAMGLRLVLDDFGSELGELAILRRFPISTLKIGQALVKTLADSPRDQAIITATVQLTRALGIRLLAAGVETHAQRELLQALGIPAAQGHAIAKPLTPGELAARFDQR
ncbi:MAG TPA: EAL domain-containing protein [Pseudogulbenkiania sp.]|nr:EAL domain-containing protein [Pseudogulbenkiania sp.]